MMRGIFYKDLYIYKSFGNNEVEKLKFPKVQICSFLLLAFVTKSGRFFVTIR